MLPSEQDLASLEWFQYLDYPMQQLVRTSISLSEELKPPHKQIADYSFLVFPMAKAYEGFLKKFLIDTNVLHAHIVDEPHFRIGRSLNPQLPHRLRDEQWVYDDLVGKCTVMGGDQLADTLWTAWTEARNGVFHYWSVRPLNLSYPQACESIERLIQAIEKAVHCLRNHMN